MDRPKEELRKALGIDEWLEVIKEDKNCDGAYVSFGQYMDILEKRIDKAINHIEKIVEEYATEMVMLNPNDLLNILKGDSE